MNAKYRNFLFWTSGGSLSGLPLGLGLSALSGASEIERWQWLGFGVLLGCITGLGTYWMLRLKEQTRPGVVIPNDHTTS